MLFEWVSINGQEPFQNNWTKQSIVPSITLLSDIKTPKALNEPWPDTLDFEMLEWLGMAKNQASRINVLDSVDPYVSEYTVPNPYEVKDLNLWTWNGPIHSSFLNLLFDQVW